MSYELKGKNVLVTGASAGIGAALAEAFAARGATVGICARRADRLDEVLARCRAHSPDSRAWTIDLSDLENRTRSHESRVADAVRSDPDIAAQVEELERQADAEDMNDIPSGDELAEEVERFLRNQRGDR